MNKEFLDKITEIAEKYIEVSKVASELRKTIIDAFSGVNEKITLKLKNGGLRWIKTTSKEKVNERGVLNYLISAVDEYCKTHNPAVIPTNETLAKEIGTKFTVKTEEKWYLDITKNKDE